MASRARYPGQFGDSQLRTLHRHIQVWRVRTALTFADDGWLDEVVDTQQSLPPLRVSVDSAEEQSATIQARTLLVGPAGTRSVRPRWVSTWRRNFRARAWWSSTTDHMFPRDHADEVAPLLLEHIEQGLVPR